jgi:hypothetical protein
MNLLTAEQALRQLARDLLFDAGEVAAWANETSRPAELGHHYSTRIFRGERTGVVGVELQVEHHVAERDFIIDVLFSLEPNPQREAN